MKKWFKGAFIALIASLFVVSVYADSTTVVKDSSVATSVDTVVTATPTPSTPSSTDDIYSFFFNVTGMILLIQIVSGWILKVLPQFNSTIKQVITWGISVGVAFVGQHYGLGMFNGISTVETVTIGVGLGMVSNHLYDVGTLDNILSIFFAKPVKKA